MSMGRHSTNSKYLPTLNWLIEVLKDYSTKHFDLLAEAAKAGIDKLEKYECLIYDTTIPFICTFLNPALKIIYLKSITTEMLYVTSTRKFHHTSLRSMEMSKEHQRSSLSEKLSPVMLMMASLPICSKDPSAPSSHPK